MKLKVLAVALGLLLVAAGSVEAGAAETVKKVLITGNKRIGTAAVKEIISVTPGKKLDRAKIAGDLRRIYGMGYFEDIEALWDPETGTLTYKLKEKPTVVAVVFKGNDAIGEDDLKEAAGVSPFQWLDEGKISDSIDAIRRLYEEKGYYLAEIKIRTEKASKDGKRVKLIYEIKEGRKIRVRRINILGNRVIGDDEIKDAMVTKERGFWSWISGSGTFQKELLEQDRYMIRQLYLAKGYIKAQIGLPRVFIDPDKRSLYMTVQISEGEQYKVREVDVSGDLIESRDKIMKNIKLKEGGIADGIKIQQDVARLTRVYGEKGYAYANVNIRTHEVEGKKEVDVIYDIQKGPLVRIERINISGNTTTRDRIIRREMEIAEGELYNGTAISLSRFNLMRLNIFEEVQISTHRGSRDDLMIIDVHVKEKSTGTLTVGMAFNSIESFQFFTQASKLNLLGLGYNLALTARLGGRTQSFDISFQNPRVFDRNVSLGVQAFNIERQYINFTQKSAGGRINLGFLLYKKGKVRWRLGIGYNFEDVDLRDMSSTVENLFDDGITSSVKFTLSRDCRDNLYDPSEGSMIYASSEFAGGKLLGGDNTFGKFILEGNWYWTVIRGRKFFIGGTVFHLRVKGGYVSSLYGDEIPLFERFFPGGIYSIRGFEIRSLGPSVYIANTANPTAWRSEEFFLGGNKEFVLNAELVFPLFREQKIKWVFFFDTGNAFDKGEWITPQGLRQSAGFGIRWYSPMGPLRFEWGFPLDRKEDEDLVVFDFAIGTLF